MTQKKFNKIIILLLTLATPIIAGPYTETGIHMDDENIAKWATACNVVRGLIKITDPSLGNASQGTENDALGKARGESFGVVSLGDEGVATLTFDESIYITNGDGNDFAVFENGFVQNDGSGNFLELAFVEVSSDGVNFFRFDAISLSPTNVQAGAFTSLDNTNIHNLAGKHLRGYGTPFDLEELKDVNELLDVNAVTHIRIIDVVGYVEPADFNGDGIVDFADYSILTATDGSQNEDENWDQNCDIHRVLVEDLPPYYEDPDGVINLNDFQIFMEKWLSKNDYANCDIDGYQINDPWPTPFPAGGFDLDAVGVINTKPRV